MKKILIGCYLFIIITLFLYSFTQIDLSLTFSRIDFLRQIVKSFQYIGYFNRPLSAFIYIFILVFLINIYFGFLIMVHIKHFEAKTIWKLIIITTGVLVFSYNAFSYDLFNYMFDAKIVTHYFQNPYIHKALDYPGDPMLSFMHWTHRVYPYGPVWLVLTVPLSFLGFNFFIPTFLFFKLLMASCYLGTTYYIGKILQKILPEKYVFGITFFALNPLVIFESLISAHLDIVMLFFATYAIYQLINSKYPQAYLLLLISIGIKFATAALIPVFLLVTFFQIKKKNISWDAVFFLGTLFMAFTIIYASYRTNYQPWYILDALFIGALVSHKAYTFITLIVISFFSLLIYWPFLLVGNWDAPVPQILQALQIISYITSAVAVLTFFITKKKNMALR